MDPLNVGIAFVIALAVACLIPAVLGTYLWIKTHEGETRGRTE
ncbi:MAG: hypothetical protein QXU65_01385 [Sulfolobales archaeon]